MGQEPAGLGPLLSSLPLLWGSLAHGLAAEGLSQLRGQLLAGSFTAVRRQRGYGARKRMGGHSAAHSGSWGGDRSRANSAGKECPRRTSRVAGLESGFRRAGRGTVPGDSGGGGSPLGGMMQGWKYGATGGRCEAAGGKPERSVHSRCLWVWGSLSLYSVLCFLFFK